MNDQKRQRMLLIGAIVSVTLLFGNQLVFTPLTAFWKGRSERIETLNADIEKGERLLNNQRRYRRVITDVERDSLPENQFEAEGIVVQALNQWSRDSRLNLTKIDSVLVSKNRDLPRMLAFRVTGIGDRSAVYSFLYFLETAPLALALEEVNIIAADDTGRELTLDLAFTGLLISSADRRREGEAS